MGGVTDSMKIFVYQFWCMIYLGKEYMRRIYIYAFVCVNQVTTYLPILTGRKSRAVNSDGMAWLTESFYSL
jgi:hypothetical protein